MPIWQEFKPHQYFQIATKLFIRRSSNVNKSYISTLAKYLENFATRSGILDLIGSDRDRDYMLTPKHNKAQFKYVATVFLKTGLVTTAWFGLTGVAPMRTQ
jgi:hypothetical protein